MAILGFRAVGVAAFPADRSMVDIDASWTVRIDNQKTYYGRMVMPNVTRLTAFFWAVLPLVIIFQWPQR
jgi:hypothetical protein